MKLTDAALKGKDLLEPREGNDLMLPQEEGGKYGGCYRGMCLVGAEAVELPLDDPESVDEDEGIDLSDDFTHTWPWTSKTFLAHPCACTINDVYGKPALFTVAHITAHLWDYHTNPEGMHAPHIEAFDDPWTFERITDWLRTIEPADTPLD
jgi:hypothetical protein